MSNNLVEQMIKSTEKDVAVFQKFILEYNNYNNAILELSQYHFINDGIFNEERQCYYPKQRSTDKEIADYNRLEKLFKRWGFRSL